jgi:1,2-diacylglycerol 3-alpha-glucosyltransferase
MSKRNDLTLCVFPNDPIISYFNKGEIKTKYFNPENIFKSIHIISAIDSDVDEEKIKKIAGNAKLKIHCIGNLNLKNYQSKLKPVEGIIQKIQPDVIRAHNPLMNGWLAAKVAKKFNIPLVLSLHDNYEKDVRGQALKNKKIFRYLKLKYTSKMLEPFVIQNSTKIICVYRYILPYVRKFGGNDIEIIYNRVYPLKFNKIEKEKKQPSKLSIIYVSRLAKEKNQECLIKAIKDVDVNLLLIGNGPDYEKLKQLTKNLKIEDKVDFKKSVPNESLVEYYNNADIFASPGKQGGIGIPIIEAMACGLPIITKKRENEESEDMDDAIMFVKNNPDGFKDAIKKIMTNKKLKEKMIQKSLYEFSKINGNIMERKEAKVYYDVLKLAKN